MNGMNKLGPFWLVGPGSFDECGGPGGPNVPGGPNAIAFGKHGRPHGAAGYSSEWEYKDLTTHKLYGEMNTDGKLFTLLRGLGLLCHMYDDKMAGEGLVLHILYNEGKMSQGELIHRMGASPDFVDHVVAKLGEDGMINATTGKLDRHTVILKLTGDGEKRARADVEERQRTFGEMFSKLDDAAKADLLAKLETLYADWDPREAGE